jgi:Rrf2 family protein
MTSSSISVRARLPILAPDAERALRVVLYFMRNRARGPISAREAANFLGETPARVAKILEDLGSQGIVRSPRGPRGGHELTVAPESLSVGAVVAAVQPEGLEMRCLFGDRLCDKRRMCEIHDRWTAVIDRVAKTLDETTIAQLLGDGPPKPASLAD